MSTRRRYLQDEKLPVLFWIYGGGFSGGSSSNPEFDGEAINRRGAILVTINYRCNVLGFFAIRSWKRNTATTPVSASWTRSRR